MISLLQRVSEARVVVDGAVIGEIGAGLLVLVCAERGDTEAQADKLLAKILKLRIFSDEAGKMNRSVQDVAAAAAADRQPVHAGRRHHRRQPAQLHAGRAARRGRSGSTTISSPRPAPRIRVVQTGRFAADMKVQLINDGPVTIPLRVK